MNSLSKNRSIFDRYPVLKSIDENKIPHHLLIIPDGNGRWAKQHRLLTVFGHKKGAQVAEEISRELSQVPAIKIVTLWGFSSDNWKRSKKEVHGLMIIFQSMVKKIIREFNESNRRFIHLGRKDRLPKILFQLIEKAEKETKNNLGQILCLAIDFGGEDQAIRMLEKAKNLPSEEMINAEVMRQLRDGNGIIPPADLIVRSSGEHRTSDIGWLNGAPTDLYFIKKLFPDVTTKDIIEGIIDFSKRERRFGARL